VALADANEKAVRSAAEEMSARGYKALAIRCDVADDGQVEAMIEQAVAAFGRLDAAYNNMASAVIPFSRLGVCGVANCA
jgi:NAD(P)-dependent dehydrogenase (short-subunit alcohol dehydrogenase family)